MRVNEVITCKKSAIMINVTQQEHDDPSFQIKVDEYKRTYDDVSIFIDGTQPMEKMTWSKKIVTLVYN